MVNYNSSLNCRSGQKLIIEDDTSSSHEPRLKVCCDIEDLAAVQTALGMESYKIFFPPLAF